MIELNLLPDIKLAYIKAQRTQRLLSTLAILITIASAVLLVVLLSIDGLQKKHLSDLSQDIKKDSATLRNEPQISKILTVQNQLESLTALHQQKPEASKLFTYLNQLTPTVISISDVEVDFTGDTIQLTGTSDTLISVNKFVDTLKYATYTTSSNTTAQPAFSNVVLSSFGLDSNGGDPTQPANYSITLSYNPDIFNITNDAKIAVPTTTTTHASVGNSTDLFKANTNTTSGGTQ